MKKLKEVLKSFLMNEGKYDADDVIYISSKVKGAANFIDYIVYWRGVVKPEIIEEEGKKCPELMSIVKELGVKY